jgi:hypothetical protein
MTDARAISAQLVDIRNIGTHKSVKLTIHAPEEQAMQIMKLFGWPTMVAPVPVALARLSSAPPPADEAPRPTQTGQAAPVGENKRTFANMAPSQQAGMFSQDRAFRLFLAEKFDTPTPDPDEAASIIRAQCKVKSRADIKPENPDWSALVLAYRLWQRHPELSEA